ncbi:uncharacterized protein [Dysidea avara]|uniref:uncharacterized protein isoform X2 n=1 Tax=Dysidea avara TaxID=196820 RepID=UPI003323B8B3
MVRLTERYCTLSRSVIVGLSTNRGSCSVIRLISIYAVVIQVLLSVSGQVCTAPETVGSLVHDEMIITADQTYILTGYRVQCEGIVTTWEFCYQILGAPSVTFYPGIWENNGRSGSDTMYSLIQANTVTFDPNGFSSFSCHNYTLPVTEQFTAPSGSVVGLYSNRGTARPLLLHSATNNNQITTYQVNGNQSSVSVRNRDDVNYNIAIRVYFSVLTTTSPTVTTVISAATTRTAAVLPSTIIDSTSRLGVSTATAVTSSVTTTTTTARTSATTIESTVTSSAITSFSTTVITMSSIIYTPNLMESSQSSTITPTKAIGGDPTVTSGGQSSANDSSVGGIIAGVVISIVACIIVVLLIIFLVWYQRRKNRRRKDATTNVHYNTSLGYVKQLDDKPMGGHPYPMVRREIKSDDAGMAAIKDDITVDYEDADNPFYYSSANQASFADNKTSEPLPYMDPAKSLFKNRPKFASNIYHTLPDVDVYEKGQTPYQYVVAATLPTGNDSDNRILSDGLPDDEKIYEDPGYLEEAIYTWFEQKKLRKIKNDNIRMLQKLGSGEFGVVHLGTWTDGSADPIQVAVKTLNSKCSEPDRVKFLREAAIMGQFQHINIVQLHGVVTEEEKMMIVLEYMSKGDLRAYLLEMKTAPQETNVDLKHDLLSFCRQVSSGLNYLASKHFVHRDLAARNILVSSDDVCKIADFGMARDIEDDTYYLTSGGKIAINWTAPEAILYKKYSTQSDVWSFGCVIYEIWSLGHKPFEKLNGREYVEKITTGYRLPPPPGCPRAIYELMMQCWHPEPKSRPPPGTITRTLQKSDRTLLPNSKATTTGDDKYDKQSLTLGAPLAAGNKLYLDFQERYMKKDSAKIS